MSDPSAANFELSIMLPLGVITNHLMKVETDLRFLNAKTLAYAKQHPAGDLAAKVAGRLEKINEALEQIQDLIAEFEADMHATANPLPPSKDFGLRKPRTDRDD